MRGRARARAARSPSCRSTSRSCRCRASRRVALRARPGAHRVRLAVVEPVVPGVASGLLLPVPVAVPWSSVLSVLSVVVEPSCPRLLVGLDVEAPPAVPLCARAGAAAASSPAIPRPATVPHPKYLIRTSLLLR